MRWILLCAVHISVLLSHPVQDKARSKELEVTCDFLKHHLVFLKDAAKDCKKKTGALSADMKPFCATSGEQVIKNCATDKECIRKFLKNVEASEKLSQCSCFGLTKAVRKLSQFSKHLCEEGNDRGERFFFDADHWNDKLDFVKDLLMPPKDTVTKTVYVPVKDDKNDSIVVNIEVINPTEPTTIPTTTTEADMSPGTGPLIDNIESALKGYDIIKGDILNDLADPGIRLQIFEYWNSTDRYNDFLDTRNSLNCARDTKSFTFKTMVEHQARKAGFYESSSDRKDEYEYGYDDEEWGWSTGYGGFFSPYYYYDYYWNRVYYQYTRSLQWKGSFQEEEAHELDFFRNQNGQIYQESRTCQLYTVSINDYAVPVFTSLFKKAVHALHEASANPESADSEAAIKKFWRQYGTHFMSKAAMGGSLTVQSRWASDAVTNGASAQRSACIAGAFNHEWDYYRYEMDYDDSYISYYWSGYQRDDYDEEEDWSSRSYSFESKARLCKRYMENSEFFNQGHFSATKKVSKGSFPLRDPAEWAKSLEGNSEVISFNLKSIGDLFTDEKLKDLHIPNLDSARLRLFYANMLKKYCEITLGVPCVEPKGCNLKDVCPDDKLCVNDADEPTGFRCEDNIVTIPTDSCSWHSADNFGDNAKCRNDQVAVGSCSGGENKDCEGKTVHQMKCCNLDGMVHYDCQTYGYKYGKMMECKDFGLPGHIILDQCHSGKNADCPQTDGDDTFNSITCCRARIKYQLVAADHDNCKTLDGTHGEDSECPANMVMVGRCGSGKNKDCDGKSHKTQCCSLKYVGWPVSTY